MKHSILGAKKGFCRVDLHGWNAAGFAGVLTVLASRWCQTSNWNGLGQAHEVISVGRSFEIGIRLFTTGPTEGFLIRSLGFLLRHCGLRIHQLLDEEELSPSSVCMFPIAAGLLVSEGPADALDTLLAIADVDGDGHEIFTGSGEFNAQFQGRDGTLLKPRFPTATFPPFLGLLI